MAKRTSKKKLEELPASHVEGHGENESHPRENAFERAARTAQRLFEDGARGPRAAYRSARARCRGPADGMIARRPRFLLISEAGTAGMR